VIQVYRRIDAKFFVVHVDRGIDTRLLVVVQVDGMIGARFKVVLPLVTGFDGFVYDWCIELAFRFIPSEETAATGSALSCIRR
jgi:hypothetical protein